MISGWRTVNVYGKKTLLGQYIFYGVSAYILRVSCRSLEIDLLAGPGNGETALSLRQVSIWLLFLTPVLLTSGMHFDTELQLGTAKLLRYGNRKRWLRRLGLFDLQAVLGWLACVFLFSGNSSSLLMHEIRYCAVLCVHLLFLISCVYLLRGFGIKAVYSAFWILLFTGTGIYLLSGMAALRNFFPGIWGMYCYSQGSTAGGFSVLPVCGIQIAWVLGTAFYLIRNRGWEKII